MDIQTQLPPMMSDPEADENTLVVYNDEVMTPDEYRRNVQQAWFTTGRQMVNVGDQQLTDAYAASQTAYSCTEYRAQQVSTIKPKITGVGGQDVDWHPFEYFLRDAPILFWFIEAGLCIWGKAYLRKLYNAHGYPTALQWLHPECVQPMIINRDQVVGYWVDGLDRQLMPNEVISILNFDPQDMLDGLSMFEVALRRILTESHLVTFAAAFFFNSARPDGILKFKSGKLEDAERMKAKTEWEQFRKSKNAHKTAVLGGDWEWIPVTAPTKDLAMVEVDENTRRAICMTFRVHPALIGAAGVSDPLSAGSTFESIERNHVQNVAKPRHERICAEMTNQWSAVDFDEPFVITTDGSSIAILNATQENADVASRLTAPTSNVLDYDEARGLVGHGPREGYLKRDPTSALQLWQQGGTTLNRLQELIGEQQLGLNGEVVLSGGQLLPASRLMEIANANADKAIKAANEPTIPNFGFQFGTPGFNQPLPLTQPPRLSKRVIVQSSSPSAYCILSLANNSLIDSVSQFARAFIETQVGVKGDAVFVPPSDFHITLVYCEVLTDEQAQQVMRAIDSLSSFTVRLSGLEVFEQPDQLVLMLRVEPDDALIDLQKQIYDACVEYGVQSFSEYSLPDKWTPHVTLAYVPVGTKFPAFNQPLEVATHELIWSRQQHQTVWKLQPNMQPRALPAPEPPPAPAIRRGTTVEVGVDLADNVYIRTCRRELAHWLSSNSLTANHWIDEDKWRLVLYRTADAKPADAAALVQALNVGELPRIDVRASGFMTHGTEVYLTFDEVEGLKRLRAVIELQAEQAGLSMDGEWKPRLLLCEGVSADVSGCKLVADGGYPVVLNNVRMYLNDEPGLIWGLRSASVEQLKELKHWHGKVAKRSKRDVVFEPVTLDGTPAARLITLGLKLGCDIDATFDHARKLLTDEALRADAVPPVPDEYESYWSHYDHLHDEIGDVWLNDYMNRAWDSLQGELREGLTESDVYAALAKYHDELADMWVGTADNPGVITRLGLAGMTAATYAIANNAPATFERHLRALTLTIDWTLLSAQALAFARSYVPELIRGIDRTTAEKVRDIIAAWTESGASIDVLAEQLNPIFNDRERSQVIAQTESNRVFNRGAYQRCEDAGVNKGRWNTVKDSDVCDICKPLEGAVAEFRSGWVHPGGESAERAKFAGKVFSHPAHPGDRCYFRPIVE